MLQLWPVVMTLTFFTTYQVHPEQPEQQPEFVKQNTKTLSENDIDYVCNNSTPRSLWSRYFGSFVKSEKDLKKIGTKNYNRVIDFLDRISNGLADPSSPPSSHFNVHAKKIAIAEFLSTDFGYRNYRGSGFYTELKARHFAFGRMSCMLKTLCNIKDCPQEFVKEATICLRIANGMLMDNSFSDLTMAFLESYGQKLFTFAGLLISCTGAWHALKWVIKTNNGPLEVMNETLNNIRGDLKEETRRFIDKCEGFFTTIYKNDFKEFPTKVYDDIMKMGLIRFLTGESNPNSSPCYLSQRLANTVESYEASRIVTSLISDQVIREIIKKHGVIGLIWGTGNGNSNNSDHTSLRDHQPEDPQNHAQPNTSIPQDPASHEASHGQSSFISNTPPSIFQITTFLLKKCISQIPGINLFFRK